MGVAFLTREKGILRREAAFEGNNQKWQILVVKTRGSRMIGIYASPSASADDWNELDVQIRRVRRLGGRSGVCGDLNARHTSWDRGAKM